MKRTIISVLLFVLTQLLSTIAAAAILIICKVDSLGAGFSLQDFQQEYMLQITVFGLIISQVLMFCILWMIGYFKPSDFIRRVPLKILLACIVMIFFGLFSLNVFNSVLNLPNLLEDQFNAMAESIPAILSIAVFGPAIEELVFRRVIIDECTAFFHGRQWAAILLSSVLFGIIHMNPAQIVFAMFAGMIFGWIYCRTGSMLPGFLGHVINNSFGMIDMRTHSLETVMGSGSGIETLCDPTVAVCLACSLLLFFLAAVYIKKRTAKAL